MGEIQVKYKEYVNDQNVLISSFKTEKFTTNGYKLYNNVIYRLAQVDKCAYLLFHFICENMDDSNNIIHTSSLRNDFIKFSKSNLLIDYKDDTVKKAFIKLVKVGLIINYDKRYDFTVNPRHVFKGSEQSRKKIIQGVIYFLKKLQKTSPNYKSALGIK
jgi:hypothetical protein